MYGKCGVKMSIKSIIFSRFFKSFLKSLTGKPKWLILLAAAAAVFSTTSGFGGAEIADAALQMVCGGE